MMVRSMYWAVLVMMLGGCNTLLGLDETVSADGDSGLGIVTAGSGDACAPLDYDPARYHAVANEAFDYDFSRRNVCAELFGADLLVVDEGDVQENANAWGVGSPPYWTGISFDGQHWRGVDGCLPLMQWAPGEPTSSNIGECAIRGAAGLVSMKCTDKSFNGEPITAMCETPRLNAVCEASMTVPSTYIRGAAAGTLFTRDVAAQACGQISLHLAEINSSDELQAIRTMFPGTTFWTGASKQNGTYVSATGCPQVFTWKSNEPVPLGDCVYVDSMGMGTSVCGANGATAEAICEDEN